MWQPHGNFDQLLAEYFHAHDLTAFQGIDAVLANVQQASQLGLGESLGLAQIVQHGLGRRRLPDGLDACYVLDLLHHLPRNAARSLIAHVYEQLRPGGVFIVKDVDTRPRYKMAFTWLLDVLMTRGERPQYWSVTDMTDALRTPGFDVIRHAMVDFLPYPHELYVCTKPR